MQARTKPTPHAHPAAARLHEKTLASRTAFQGRALRLDVLDIELPDGRLSTREIVRHSGAVAVLARLPDGRFLFVRQYRKAIEQAFVEVVAGGLEPGEAPDASAHRELREESGYGARRLLPLGAIVACPGYSEERLHLFYADLEERPGAQQQDSDENVETLLLTEESVEQAVLDGTIEDAKTLACWLLWKLRGPAQPLPFLDSPAGAQRARLPAMPDRPPDKPRPSRLGRWLRLPGDSIWDLELDQLNGLRRRLVAGLRVLQMVWRGFRHDECQLHASALTYYSLMSLVPILALALALARVFGGENIARERVAAEIAAWGRQFAVGGATESAAVVDLSARLTHYSDRIFDQIGDISFGTLGGVGLVVLLSMTVGMLSQVEHSFNRVWNAPPRPMWRKFADYLSVVLIVPFLALAASTIPVADFLARHVGGLVGNLPGLDGFAFLLKRLLVALLTSTVFVFVIMFVPNTRVRLKAGLIGGVTTALFFTVWLKLCAALQIGVVKYSKLYGGFAALPIVLAWTYVSWQIVLFGAELAFAVQNAETYGREQAARHAGIRARWQLALGVAVEIARAMADGSGPFDIAAYARRRRISVRLLNSVIDDLRHAGLICAAAQPPDRYLLARDPAHLPARDVVAAVLRRGAAPESLGLGNLDGNVRDLAARAEAAWDAALAPAVAGLVETATPLPRHNA